MRLNKKSGFTLLEIIIVIIIVGVLASLALPRFFTTIEYSRSTEALTNLGVIRKSVERCLMTTTSGFDASQCNTFGSIDIANPSAAGGALFVYTFANGVAAGTIDMIATRTVGTDIVMFQRLAGLNAAITKTGTGAFSAIK
jgi:type IV pilus assembly protein PilA